MALDNKTAALLKKLKEGVDLEEFLISEGFYVDIHSSWGDETGENRKENMVYKNGVYKLGVSFDEGTWICYDMKGNLSGPKGSGDIVQVYRELYGKTFREALNDLSKRYGSSRLKAKVKTKNSVKTKDNIIDDPTKPRRWKKIEEDLNNLKLVTEFWHLEVERGIKRETLNSKRFFGKIYHGNCNVMFPHVYKTCGRWVPCGYEIKRKNYSRFSSEGIRGLWFSHVEKDDHTIVLCESAIDCLSWHDIHDSPEGVAYVSVAGRISKAQFALLKFVLLAAKDHKPPTKIVLSFDNDTAGRGFTREVQNLVPELQMTIDPAPSGYKDWNEFLTDDKET